MSAVVAVREGKGRFWGWLGLVVAIAGLVPVVVLAPAIFDHSASQRERRWFGHVASFETIVLISIAIGLLHAWAVRRALSEAGGPPSVPGILVGADNRLSTSKLSAFAWTWVLAWAILSLAFADWVEAPIGWNAFLHEGLRDEYLVLLGGPFVALVSAKALVGNAISKGELNKPPAGANETKPADRLAQAFSDDTGQADLVDTQYLLFGAIALLVFVVMFIRASYAGLPRVPEVLIGLASIGAGTYIANKWTAEDAKPKLDRVIPDRAKVGEQVTLYGSQLLSVSQGGRRLPASEPLRILYGGRGEQLVSPRAPGAQRSAAGTDYLRFTVAPTPAIAAEAAGTTLDINVVNALGVLSESAVQLTIIP